MPLFTILKKVKKKFKLKKKRSLKFEQFITILIKKNKRNLIKHDSNKFFKRNNFKVL